MLPTINGWCIQVGCWKGTRAKLRNLISKDEDWPEARGEEVSKRRPGLLRMLDLADEHAEYHADKLAVLIERWGDPNEVDNELSALFESGRHVCVDDVG